MISLWKSLPPPDPRTAHFFLVDSTYNIFIVIAIYLLFVYKIGPALMKNRRPFKLKGVMIAYNLFQVMINTWLFIMSVPFWPKTNLFCSPIDPSYEPDTIFLTRLVYYFFTLKLLDFVETIFFVLRKKNKQLSSLHVFHHVGTLLGVWVGVRWYPGGQGLYIGAFNTVVHIAMYIYYLLSIWDPQYKTSIWWKKHLTQVQIMHQVALVITMSGPLLMKDCSFPRILSYLVIFNNGILIPMFVNFYFKNYVFEKKSA